MVSLKVGSTFKNGIFVETNYINLARVARKLNLKGRVHKGVRHNRNLT